MVESTTMWRAKGVDKLFSTQEAALQAEKHQQLWDIVVKVTDQYFHVNEGRHSSRKDDQHTSYQAARCILAKREELLKILQDHKATITGPTGDSNE